MTRKTTKGRELGPHDRIGARQATVLAALADRSGVLTVTEIKARIGRPDEHRSTLGSALKRLCQRGFMNRTGDVYSITAKGRAALADAPRH